MEGFSDGFVNLFNFYGGHASDEVGIGTADGFSIVAVVVEVAAIDDGVADEAVFILPGKVGRIERRGFDDDLVGHFHRGGEVHEGGIDTGKGVAVFQERSGLPKVARVGREGGEAFRVVEDLGVVALFFRAAKEEDAEFGMVFMQAMEEFAPVGERPALELEVLGAAGADVDAENFASGKLMGGDEFVGPVEFVGLEVNFEIVIRQERLFVEKRKEAVVVLDAVDGVVLRHSTVDECAVEAAVAFVLVAEAQAGTDETGDGAIVDAAQGVDVDGDVVVLAAEFAQEGQGVERAVLDEVLLVNGVEVRIAFKDVLGTSPEDEGINGGSRIVGA